MPYSQVFVSTGAIRSSSCQQVVETLLSSGISKIELTAGMNADDQVLAELCELSRGKATFMVHNYFPPPPEPFVLNLASNDPGVLRKGLDHCRRAINLSHQFGANLYTVHSGFCFHAEPKHLGREQSSLRSIPRADAEIQFAKSMQELAEFGKGLGVSLAIENNVVTPSNGAHGADRYLCVDSEDTVRILNMLAESGVGLLLDVGHLKVSAATFKFDPEQFIRVVAPRIKALHLNDNDGTADTNTEITAESWFWRPLQKYVHQKIPYVLEVYNQSTQSLREQLDLIQRFLSPEESKQFSLNR